VSPARLRATGFLGAACAVVASATIWLVLTDPVTTADAVQRRDLLPLLAALAQAVGDSVRTLLCYL
jgi:hypothetical protein